MEEDRKRSNSREQVEAENRIFSKVEQKLGVALKRNEKVFVADDAAIYIVPDFYSEEAHIVGEIFAHIGKPKKAQDNKIANDILKMMLLEKAKRTAFHKILVVCDEAEQKKLQGKSALAESIRRFGVDVMYIEADAELREMLAAAQKRQRMVNG